MMFKKFIIGFIVFVMCFNLILYFDNAVVLADGTSYHSSFDSDDGGVAGQPYNDNGLLSSYHTGTAFEVSATEVYDDDLAFRMDGSGWFNLTDGGSEINQFNFYIYQTGVPVLYLWFFDSEQYDAGDITPWSTLETDAIIGVMIEFVGGETGFAYLETDDTWNYISAAVGGWNYVDILINSVTSVSYSYAGTTEAGFIHNSTATLAGMSMNRVFWYVQVGPQYVDNFTFVVGSITGSDSQQGGSGYDQIGEIYESTLSWSGHVEGLEIERAIPFSGTIKGIDLLVSSDMSDDVSNRLCVINGYSAGVASHTIEYSSSSKIMRWENLTVDVDVDSLILEFWTNPDYDASVYEWIVRITNNDVDDDGDTEARAFKGNMLLDGKYNGFIPIGYDFIYAVYIESVDEPSPPSDDTWIGVDAGVINQYSYVTVSYGLSNSDSVYDTYMKFYHDTLGQDGTNQSFGGDGKILDSAMGSEEFFCWNSGNYIVSLNRSDGSEVCSISFTVTANDDDFIIWTEPTTVNSGHPYRVFYKYIHNSGTDGLIYASYDEDWDDGVIISNIASNGFGSFPYYDTSESAIYFTLCVNLSVDRMMSQCRLLVIDYLPFDNFVDVLHDTLVYDISEYQTICFGHRYPNGDVVIRINGQKVLDVGGHVEGCFDYRIVNYKEMYNVSLDIVTNNGTRCLDFVYFNVSYSEGWAGESHYFAGLSEEEFFTLMGFVVFGIFLVFGIGLGAKIKNNPTVSSFTIGTLGICGLCVSTVIGWFAIWIPFLVGLFIVAGVFLMIKMR